MKFYNHPEYIEPAKYDEQLHTYVGHVKQNSDVLAIFTMGSVTSPGLSDLDIIVVMADCPRTQPCLSVFELGLDSRIFLHDVLVVNESNVDNFDYILSATNLSPVYIKDKQEIKLPRASTTSTYVKLMQIVDLNRMRVEQFIQAMKMGECDIRHLVTRVSSIIHSVRMCDELKVKLPTSVRDYMDEVREIRKKWTDSKGTDIAVVKDIFYRGCNAFGEVLNAVAIRLSQEIDPYGSVKDFQLRMLGFRFSETDGYRLAKKNKRNQKMLLLPRCFKYHYDGYLHHRKSPYHEEQRHRYKIARDHNAFLARNGFGFSMRANLGLPLSGRKTLLQMLRNIMH